MIRTKQRSNKAQVAYLCRYMAQHRQFAAGEFQTPQGAAQQERQWLQLQAALDELGPHQSVEQWKICWRDQKRKARVEGGAINREMASTGNRGVVPNLSENTRLVLSTIGNAMAQGFGPAESPIGFTTQTPLTSSSTSLTTQMSTATLLESPPHVEVDVPQPLVEVDVPQPLVEVEIPLPVVAVETPQPVQPPLAQNAQWCQDVVIGGGKYIHQTASFNVILT